MRIRSLFLLVLLACAIAAPALAHKAKDLLDQQDFAQSPPVATSPLEDWISWVQTKQGGDYERSGGQPFAAPVPPGLPPDVVEINIQVSAGTRVTTSGSIECTDRWYEVFVSILFDDGSRFIWMDEGHEQTCSDGSSQSWVKTISTAGVEDPITQAWSGWVRSCSVDAMQAQRSMRLRAQSGGTLDLTSLPAGSLPWVGAEVDSLDIAIGPGGVLDLRGNPAANGPIFSTSGPALLRCDFVLMDPGVTIADLFVPPPIVLPGADLHELVLGGPAFAHLDAAGPASVAARILNVGNAAELAQVTWSDALGWSTSSPIVVPLAPFQPATKVQIPLFVPPQAQPGESSALIVQAASIQAPPTALGVSLERVAPAAPPQVYCAAKVSSIGCVPQIAWTGDPTFGAYDDFHVLATGAINNKVGLLIRGGAAASLPFQGGTLCVQPPVKRTPPQGSQGNVGSPDCSGTYSFHFSHEYLDEEGLAPGTGVWCQYWMRDPQDAFGSCLSNALAFHVAP